MKTKALKDLCRDGEITVRVTGQCMAPLVCEGDTVTVSSSRFYWPGSILLFHHSGGELRLHRLIGYRFKQRSLELITRGDRCDSFDTPIPLHDVIGRVTTIAPRRPGRLNGVRAWRRGVLQLARVAVRAVLS